jgi:hypothetical protein
LEFVDCFDSTIVLAKEDSVLARRSLLTPRHSPLLLEVRAAEGEVIAMRLMGQQRSVAQDVRAGLARPLNGEYGFPIEHLRLPD